MDSDVAAIIAGIREQVNGIQRRLDKLENLTSTYMDKINEIAISIKGMYVKQQAIEDKMEEISHDVNEMKDKPGKKWENASMYIVTAILGALIGLIVKSFVK